MLAVMGAEAFAERARRELLATGEIVRERTTMQVSALTAGEAHIARLAADGTTNPGIAAQLYLSVRIADRHDGPFGEKDSHYSERDVVLPSAAPRPRSGRRTRDGDFGKGRGYCR